MSLITIAFSAVFYGCQLWCCSDSQLHKVRVAWNNAIRKICNVRRRGCHVDTMIYSTGLLPLPEMLRKRKLQFLSSLIQSENSVIAYISSLKYNSQQSSFLTSCREWELHYCQSHTRVCRDSQLLMTFERTLIYLYLSLGTRPQAWHTTGCLNQLEVVNQY